MTSRWRVPARLRETIASSPASPAIWDRGTWWTWGDIGRLVEQLEALIGASGLARVGVMMRTAAPAAASELAVLAGQRTLVPFNPVVGDEKLTADLEKMRVRLLLGGLEDVQRPAVQEAAAQLGITVAAVYPDDSTPLQLLCKAPLEDDSDADPDVAVWMLTSGTTGPPKRIPTTFSQLDNMMAAVSHYRKPRADAAAPVAKPVIVAAPIVHSSGFGGLLRAAYEPRPAALLERFSAEPWADLVEEHEPRYVGLPPAALRMILDARIPRDKLRSLRAIGVGTAALPVDLADEFESTYDIPLLPVYGATEFPGGLAGWSITDRRTYGTSKRASVGKPHPGVELRVIDPETRHDLPAGARGLLVVRTPTTQSAEDGWIVTNDLASVDEDGFLYIHGRADDAIIRGGFKIVPAEIEAELERHPNVRAAGVVGIPDRRLGAVPVALVEADASGEDIRAWLRERVTPYQLPVEVRVVDALPRTPSMKISKEGLRTLLAEQPPTR